MYGWCLDRYFLTRHVKLYCYYKFFSKSSTMLSVHTCTLTHTLTHTISLVKQNSENFLKLGCLLGDTLLKSHWFSHESLPPRTLPLVPPGWTLLFLKTVVVIPFNMCIFWKKCRKLNQLQISLEGEEFRQKWIRRSLPFEVECGYSNIKNCYETDFLKLKVNSERKNSCKTQEVTSSWRWIGGMVNWTGYVELVLIHELRHRIYQYDISCMRRY